MYLLDLGWKRVLRCVIHLREKGSNMSVSIYFLSLPIVHTHSHSSHSHTLNQLFFSFFSFFLSIYLFVCLSVCLVAYLTILRIHVATNPQKSMICWKSSARGRYVTIRCLSLIALSHKSVHCNIDTYASEFK